MATAAFFTSFDMGDTSTAEGFTNQQTTTLLRVEDNADTNAALLRQDYTGHFVLGPSGSIVGGTLEGFSEFDRTSATDTYHQRTSITGVSVDAATAFQFLQTGDVNGFYGLVFAGNDQFNGSSGNDVVHAQGGDDILIGHGGNDTLDGGAGIDTAIFDLPPSQYTITGTLGGTMSVAGSDGTKSLSSIEALAFDDVQHGGGFRGGGEVHLADLRGNGEHDLIMQGNDNTFWVSLADANGGLSSPFWAMQHGGSFRDGGETHLAQLTASGRDDLIFQGADNSFWVSLSDGTGHFSTPMWSMQHGGTYENGQAQFVDLTGTGRHDLIFQSNDNMFWVSMADGSGHFSAPSVAMQHGGTFIAGEAHYADLTGTGREDLIYQSLDNHFWVSLSDGQGHFSAPVMALQHGGTFRGGDQVHFADINGDGKDDLILQGNDNTFWLSLSDGQGGFSAPANVMKHGGEFRDGSETHFADVNNDGKADLIFQGADNTFWLSLSVGTGFAAPKEMVKVPGTYQAGEAKVADVNGDHSADLVFQTTDNHFMVSLGGSHDFLLS